MVYGFFDASRRLIGVLNDHVKFSDRVNYLHRGSQICARDHIFCYLRKILMSVRKYTFIYNLWYEIGFLFKAIFFLYLAHFHLNFLNIIFKYSDRRFRFGNTWSLNDATLDAPRINFKPQAVSHQSTLCTLINSEIRGEKVSSESREGKRGETFAAYRGVRDTRGLPLRDVIPSAPVPSRSLERAGSIAIYIVA